MLLVCNAHVTEIGDILSTMVLMFGGKANNIPSTSFKVQFGMFSPIQKKNTAKQHPTKTKNMYTPPFTVSTEAINLIAEISGQIERYAIRLEGEDGLRLRKANRIKTIHSSLAIEGNTLSEDEIISTVDNYYFVKNYLS